LTSKDASIPLEVTLQRATPPIRYLKHFLFLHVYACTSYYIQMTVWDSKRVETNLNKIWANARIENHIIRASPKNPRKGADLALKFKNDILPEILKDVAMSIQNKQLHGDVIDETVVRFELIARINTELVKFGVAMIPISGNN
jgi:hypothetical protein